MSTTSSPSAESPPSPELDALVLVMNEELVLLERLHFRLTVLRQILLEGTPQFIQWAAADVEEAAAATLEHERRTVEALSDARAALGSPAERVVDLALVAPESHRRVLLRLARAIQTTSRSLTSLRDIVRRHSETGRQAMSAVLDLTDDTNTPAGSPSEPGQLFRGAI